MCESVPGLGEYLIHLRVERQAKALSFLGFPDPFEFRRYEFVEQGSSPLFESIGTFKYQADGYRPCQLNGNRTRKSSRPSDRRWLYGSDVEPLDTSEIHNRVDGIEDEIRPQTHWSHVPVSKQNLESDNRPHRRNRARNECRYKSSTVSVRPNCVTTQRSPGCDDRCRNQQIAAHHGLPGDSSRPANPIPPMTLGRVLCHYHAVILPRLNLQSGLNHVHGRMIRHQPPC